MEKENTTPIKFLGRIHCEFTPKEDITAFELAKCLEIISNPVRMEIYYPDDSIIRHFNITKI